MLRSAHARNMRPAPALRARVTLRAADNAQERAENIIHMLGMNGDPNIIATHIAVVRDLLAEYATLDRSQHEHDKARRR